MSEFLKHVLGGQNQFASGGLLLMLIGSIGVFVRGLPDQLWSWFVQQTTMMITVKDDDDSFVWVKEWVPGAEVPEAYTPRGSRHDAARRGNGVDPSAGAALFLAHQASFLGLVLPQ